ncbi:MAG: lipoyl synthase [Gammaproteobacteria bacterium]|nr:lipoyl synthase [Gammaproteobacteria bacterium]MBL6998924.1 lipoyl synthase [Gammaproteobacteria bacterium]
MSNETYKSPEPGVLLRGADKLARIPIKVVPKANHLPKPKWLKVKLPTGRQAEKVRELLRANKLNTVCEEAACPNLPECFGHGTATFMILGQVCTRRCPFCEVGHGRPLPVDTAEPAQLADAVASMRLKYVVITSVDRDDLRDGGAQHFADCVAAVRAAQPGIRVETLTPDFRGRMDIALDALSLAPPDVFNHNMETVPRLYKKARPGADYQWSLDLIRRFGERHPQVPTKSGLMVGLGEEVDEIMSVMRDLRAHGCSMLTIGQYLAPSDSHLPIEAYYTPQQFDELKVYGESIGFKHVASGPLVRSSYHADVQASGLV